MYKISIIIPCYNAEKYIEQCMESILRQSIGTEYLEIILVDDASTDNTVTILKKYEQTYPDNIMLILCEKNGRQGTARNIGLSYATGDYVSFVDADDWIHPDMYKILQKVLETTECDAVQFYGRDCTEYRESELLEHPECTFLDVSAPDARKKMLLNSAIWNEGCWCKIYKRELIEKSKVKFAEGMTYEEPLFTYPLQFWADRIGNLNAVLYYHRNHGESVTFHYMNNPKTIMEHLEVQLEVLKFMKNTGYYKEYKDEIDLYFIHSFYAEAFYFTKYRKMRLPVSLFCWMVETLEKIIPDYKENPYLRDESLKEENSLLELAGDMKKLSGQELQKRIDEMQEQI